MASARTASVSTRQTQGARATKKARAPSATRRDPLAPAASQIVQQLNAGFPLTHLNKVLSPELGLTKAELMAYYTTIADWMLPHVARRPLVLVRCPEGRRKSCFVQKHVDESTPDAVLRVTIDEAGSASVYGYVEELAGLLALAELGALEIHTLACHVGQLEQPDRLVFDLKPGAGLPFERVAEAAFDLREELARLGLESFVKTTGADGLHVVVPLAARHGWDEHEAFARALVTTMAKAEPDRYATTVPGATRDAEHGEGHNKICLDYLSSARGASAIAPYSPRASTRALIATPLTWGELQNGARPEHFDLRAVVRRLEADARDPWRGFWELSQSLPSLALQRLALT